MDLVFSSSCVEASLSGPVSLDCLEALDAALACYMPGYRYTWLYQHGKWDGKRHFLNRESMSFPAGLASRVVEVLERRGITPTVVDHRPLPPWGSQIPEIPDLHGIVLAPDQRAVVRQALVAKQGCLALPTSFGKTECAAAVLAAARPVRGIVLVNKRGLLTQTADRLEQRLGERVGRVGAGWSDTRQRVTVATIQTLWAHRQRFRDSLYPDQAIVIYDEIHTVADTGLAVLSDIHAPVRLGLSATVVESPKRLFLEAYIGPLIAEGTLHDLIETGRAAVPTVVMLRVGGFVHDNVDYSVAYREGIVRNAVRNRAILDTAIQCIQSGQQVMILVQAIAHGRSLQVALAPWRVPFLHGGTPIGVVDDAKRAFGRRDLPCLLVSTIFDMGQDVPAIEVLILAAGGRSPVRTVQRFGRAVRRKPTGENTVVVVDFWDTSHGWLETHSRDRQRAYHRKGFTPHLADSYAAWLTSHALESARS